MWRHSVLLPLAALPLVVASCQVGIALDETSLRSLEVRVDASDWPIERMTLSLVWDSPSRGLDGSCRLLPLWLRYAGNELLLNEPPDGAALPWEEPGSEPPGRRPPESRAGPCQGLVSVEAAAIDVAAASADPTSPLVLSDGATEVTVALDGAALKRRLDAPSSVLRGTSFELRWLPETDEWESTPAVSIDGMNADHERDGTSFTVAVPASQAWGPATVRVRSAAVGVPCRSTSVAWCHFVLDGGEGTLGASAEIEVLR